MTGLRVFATEHKHCSRHGGSRTSIGSLPCRAAERLPLRSRIDQQIAELATHDWDLVRATGVEVSLNPELAERALNWSRQVLRPEFRGPDKAFGAEVPVPEDAPIYDRLAGWFGRDPHWEPATAG